MGVPPGERTKDRVAIVGFCMPHRDWVDYDDETQEVWGLNRGYVFQGKSHRWFELHGPAIHEWQQRRPGKHVQFLANFDGPVYMHQARPDLIPNSVDYPLKEVAEFLGVNVSRFTGPTDPKPGTNGVAEPYLSSTVSQEIALAICMGFKEIALYGIDLNTSSEYAWQKPGVEYMLGLAVGRGIKVLLPEECPLLKGPIYGRGYLSPRGENLSPEQWMERINARRQQKEQIEGQMNRLMGARDECTWTSEQMPGGVDQEIVDQRRQQIERSLGSLQAQVYQVIGGLEETLHWAHQTPDGMNPKEALGALVATVQVELGATPNGNSEAVIGRMYQEHHIDENQDEGPTDDRITGSLMDVPQSASGRVVPEPVAV